MNKPGRACASWLVFSIVVWVAPHVMGTAASAQRSMAPVDISGGPLPLKQGEEGTLRVQVVALANVDRLDVSITAANGVVFRNEVAKATFRNVKGGEKHEFPVAVRLTSADVGYVNVAATIEVGGVREFRAQALTVGTPRPAAARLPVGPDEDLANLTLVKIGRGAAVVRFSGKPLAVISVGDQLGRNRADVIEISDERLVLDETFTGPDGRPNRARVTLKEGEKGGTRVLTRPDEEPPPAHQIRVVRPGAEPKAKQ